MTLLKGRAWNENTEAYLKFMCAPAPFQSPGIGFGSNETTIPKCSDIRDRIYLAIQVWSERSIPSTGPIWNSHCNQEKNAALGSILLWLRLKSLFWRTRGFQFFLICVDNVFRIRHYKLPVWNLATVQCLATCKKSVVWQALIELYIKLFYVWLLTHVSTE